MDLQQLIQSLSYSCISLSYICDMYNILILSIKLRLDFIFIFLSFLLPSGSKKTVFLSFFLIYALETRECRLQIAEVKV